MINATEKTCVFIVDDARIDDAVRKALRRAAGWVRKTYGINASDDAGITTKTNVSAAFAKYASQCLLKQRRRFDKQYVLAVFDAYTSDQIAISEDQFYEVTRVGRDGPFAFKNSYAAPIKRGLGALLVALHCQRTIVLPISFHLPYAARARGPMNRFRNRHICHPDGMPELLRFIRSLDSQSDAQSEEAFEHLSRRQREVLSSLGTKLLLATGWLDVKDARIGDLLELKMAEDSRQGSKTSQAAFRPLIQALVHKYGRKIDVSMDGWTDALAATRYDRSREARVRAASDSEVPPNPLDVILEDAVATWPSDYAPDSVPHQAIKLPPHQDLDPETFRDAWIGAEKTYLVKVKRENPKNARTALGYLNIYLFLYLPGWYEFHPNSGVSYPDSPNKLIAAVFVSNVGRLNQPNQARPLGLVAFLELVAEEREWAPTTHYATLKQIEVFFDFIERYGDDMTGCGGFRQPLQPMDYPPVTASKGTNKRPIPKRLFKFALEYAEALLAHTNSLIERIVSGETPAADLEGLARPTYLDTFERAAQFGVIPIVVHSGKVYPLRFIPNTLTFARVKLMDGPVLPLPQPHGLNHVVCALYTGIRGNHIQWLDATLFDSHPTEPESGRSLLWVNTDKTKSSGWTAWVNPRVIEVLRAQRSWRERIDGPEFRKKVHYNNNSKSKWGSFLPLFSVPGTGKPHSDTRYSFAWKSLLAGMQGMLTTIGEPKLERPLCRLLPPDIPYGAANLPQQLRERGAGEGYVCGLVIKSDITPHSARVSVISNLISVLPANIIGKFVTGQSPAALYHYVKIEEEEVNAKQLFQALDLRERAYHEGLDDIARGDGLPARRFVHADDVNSNLARSMKQDLNETLVAYGGVSIILSEGEKTGLDVLRETCGENAAANKTEICPYGNNCPPDVIRQLSGWRRCALCIYAVRVVDHLPAISAKVKQVAEMLDGLDRRFAQSGEAGTQFTSAELDQLENERQRYFEDFTAWVLVEEVLDETLRRLESGEETKRWVVSKPEVLEERLRRVPAPDNFTQYVLARLPECIAFPMLDSPQIRAQFDLMRRKLLAFSGRLGEAFGTVPVDPAAECAGLIRTIAAANNLSAEDLTRILESEEHLMPVPHRPLRLLTGGEQSAEASEPIC